jgi:hypothetical protein
VTFWRLFICATLQRGLKRHEIWILHLPQARHTFIRPSPPLPDSPAVQLGSICNISFNTPNRRPVYTSHQGGQSGNSCPSPLPHAEQLTSVNFREGNNREFGLIHIDWSSLFLSPHFELTTQLIKRQTYTEPDYTCPLPRLHTCANSISSN